VQQVERAECVLVVGEVHVTFALGEQIPHLLPGLRTESAVPVGHDVAQLVFGLILLCVRLLDLDIDVLDFVFDFGLLQLGFGCDEAVEHGHEGVHG